MPGDRDNERNECEKAAVVVTLVLTAIQAVVATTIAILQPEYFQVMGALALLNTILAIPLVTFRIIPRTAEVFSRILIALFITGMTYFLFFG